jgi:PAS domain S-box-containing protein
VGDTLRVWRSAAVLAGVWTLITAGLLIWSLLLRKEPGAVAVVVSCAALWLLGLLGLAAVGWRLRLRRQERERIRQQLAEKSVFLENILRSSLEHAIVTTDLDLRISYFNPRAEQLFGHRAEDVVGTRLPEVPGIRRTLPHDFPGAIARIRRFQWSDDPVELETGDGARVIASLVSGILTPTRELVGFALYARDVTAQRRAEERIRHLARGVESAGEAIILTDRRGVVQYVNPAFTRLSGYAAAEAIGRRPRIFSRGMHARGFKQELWQTVRAGRIWTGEVTDSRKDGSPYESELTVAPVLTPEGFVEGYVGVQVDVTQRNRDAKSLAERTRELERANEDLLASNAELDEFTRIASHDLQEPLRKLIAFSEILARDLGGQVPERAARDLRHITDAAQRMQALVRGLLTLSRAGRSAMKCEHVSLDQCLDRALDVLALRIEETGATIRRDKLPIVWGDGLLLTQLYQNLIANALKFAGDAPPDIHLTASEENGRMVFGVADRGIGLKPEYADQIFQPFKQLHSRTEYEGAGIGLAICRRIVERHDGEIWVESELGEGAHFRFTLPDKHQCECENAANRECAAAAPELV